MDSDIKWPQKHGGRLFMGSIPWSSSSKVSLVTITVECVQFAISRGLSWALCVVTFTERNACQVSGWLHWILLLFNTSSASCPHRINVSFPTWSVSVIIIICGLKIHHSSLRYLTRQCLITVDITHKVLWHNLQAWIPVVCQMFQLLEAADLIKQWPGLLRFQLGSQLTDNNLHNWGTFKKFQIYLKLTPLSHS